MNKINLEAAQECTFEFTQDIEDFCTAFGIEIEYDREYTSEYLYLSDTFTLTTFDVIYPDDCVITDSDKIYQFLLIVRSGAITNMAELNKTLNDLLTAEDYYIN